VNDFYLSQPAGQSLLITPKPAAVLVPESDAVYPRLVANPAWREAYHGSRNAVFLPK